jgi:DNA-binding transcriptional ArsR family regulator
MSLTVVPGETAELRALAHPLRLRMLSLLTGAAMTAAEIARELSITHANASYHLRQLLAAGAIQAAGQERIRGGTAKRYRYRPGLPRLGADAPARVAAYLALAAELQRRAPAVRPTPDRSQFTDAELWVDPQVWTNVRAAMQEASRQLHLAAQPPRTAGTIRVNASIALFEMEPDA